MGNRHLLIPCVIVWAWFGVWNAPLLGQPQAMPATVLPGESTWDYAGPGPTAAAPLPEADQFALPAPVEPYVPEIPPGPGTPAAGYPVGPWAVLGADPSSVPWTWQVVPPGLLYKAYLAGGRESRLGLQWTHEKDAGWLWDATVGGRAGLIRWGSEDALLPEGWQLDIDAAAFPRLDSGRNLVSVDFRAGFPLTGRSGPWEFKFGPYHYCSHLSDIYLLDNPDMGRLNYSRDSLVLGVSYRPCPNWRFYTEADWAFRYRGGARPWQFQFGIDYSPFQPTGFWGAPFAAVNGEIRQEVNYGGGVTAQAGWQWRGAAGHLTRFGAHYYNGMSLQRQFLNEHEQLVGLGLWYDF